MSDKKALLEQLTIDRSDSVGHGSESSSKIVPIVFLVVGIALGFFAQGFFVSTTSPEVYESVAVSQPELTRKEPEQGISSDDNRSLLVATKTQPVLSASGYVVARRMATVSSEITGLITEVLVEEGLAVEKGQVLARLDDEQASLGYRLAQANVESSRAAISSVKARLQEAKRVLVREKGLIKSNLSSEARLTSARANVEVLEAELVGLNTALKVARLSVDSRREDLDDTVIKAPFSGVVVNKAAQAGEMVSPVSAGGGFTRTGICTLVDMDSLEIEVDVNEAFIGRVYSGQLAVANLDAYPERDIEAKIIAIVPTADRAKATVRVRIGIEDKDKRILPNMGVKVDFL